LVIDIRGNADGFRGYFVPVILAPLAAEQVQLTYYIEHTGGFFAENVLNAFRQFYGADRSVSIAVGGGEAAVGGQVWLVVCSGALSGPNHAYLQLAVDTGFTLVYDPCEECTGWSTSFFHLPHSGLRLRYNPLKFTWEDGRPFEKYPVQPRYNLAELPWMEELLNEE
jgi:hypothetical protein